MKIVSATTEMNVSAVLNEMESDESEAEDTKPREEVKLKPLNKIGVFLYL